MNGKKKYQLNGLCYSNNNHGNKITIGNVSIYKDFNHYRVFFRHKNSLKLTSNLHLHVRDITFIDLLGYILSSFVSPDKIKYMK